jgi:hypothetical protein
MEHLSDFSPKITYNLRELIDATGLGRTTLCSLMKSGEITRIKVGSRTLVTAQSVDELIKRLSNRSAS